MPVTVKDLLEGPKENTLFLRSRILEFLKKNSNLAYTLNEIYTHFLELDKKGPKKYKNEKVLYKLIYGYLNDFVKKEEIVHKGHFYFYKQ